MKKIFLTLILAAGVLSLQAQKVVEKKLATTPNFLTVGGNCTVQLVRADHNSIVYTLPDGVEEPLIMTTSDKLAINTMSGIEFTLNYAQDTLPMLFSSSASDGSVLIKEGDVKIRKRNQMDMLRIMNFAGALAGDNKKDTLEYEISEMEVTIDSTASAKSSEKDIEQTLTEVLEKVSTMLDKKSTSGDKPKYPYRKRTYWQLHWALNNIGTSPLNGLMGMQLPEYDMRTSFSSYQLSYNYSFIMTSHFRAAVGVAYESDVYKYRTDYVTFADGAFTTEGRPDATGVESRLVARYFDLPITIGFRDKRSKFELKLSAIPGLGYSGNHTGMKHILTNGGQKEKEYAAVSAMNPFKLDARMELDFKAIGIFLQVPTQPLFVGEGIEKVYPLKFGASLRF